MGPGSQRWRQWTLQLRRRTCRNTLDLQMLRGQQSQRFPSRQRCEASRTGASSCTCNSARKDDGPSTPTWTPQASLQQRPWLCKALAPLLGLPWPCPTGATWEHTNWKLQRSILDTPPSQNEFGSMECCEDAKMDRVEISVDQTVHFGNCEFPAVYFGNFLMKTQLLLWQLPS